MERLLRRSHATGLRWAALSLVGLSVAAACSDDSSTPADKPAVGGEAGESSVGGVSTAGTAGKSDGGTIGGGAAGMDSAGEGGMAGMPQVLTLGEACSACGATECTDTLAGCNDSLDCSAWLACLTACDSSECVATCDGEHVDAARVYAGVYDCLCTSCQDDCSAAGACEKQTCVDDNPLTLMPTAPASLAETGLYATIDGAGGAGSGGAGGAGSVELAMPIQIASYVRTFEPKFPLWADDATKDRYVYIPKCSTIDTTDMDHWKFPVGTTFWKTFKVGQITVETRMLHRFGAGVLDWTYAAYQWDPNAIGGVNTPLDPAAAMLAPDVGVANANTTTHDIPSIGQCKQCHNGLEEKVLGFGAFQLSHETNAADLTIEKISELGWLTTPAPDGFEVPGTAVQQAALGYMHGNCGGCHSEKTPTPATKPQLLRLMVGQTTYATTDAVTTTVNQLVVGANAAFTGKDRIEPMEPDNSAILIRMKSRTPGVQMPPLGSKVADTDGGVKAVTDWVNSIPK
jgi:hypothetical protein